MRETAKAKKAWADYVSLGADRSLEKLLARYQNATDFPTRRIMTLKDWSRHFDWQARLSDIAEQERAAIVKRGIADKQNRIDDYHDLRSRLKKVVVERERQHENIDDLVASPAAGASSGLMVLTVRYLPGGGRVEEWALDSGLVKSLLEVNKQAAQELGEWTEKKELTGKDGGPIEISDVRDELARRLNRFAARGGPAGSAERVDGPADQSTSS